MILIAIGLISKIIYYKYLGEPSPWSIKTATNLPGSTVQLLDTGESSASNNFLTKEFGYQVGSNTIFGLRVIAIFLMFIVPSIILFSIHISAIVFIVLAVSNYLGTMIERWLFFAEAKHVINLFYGRKS